MHKYTRNWSLLYMKQMALPLKMHLSKTMANINIYIYRYVHIYIYINAQSLQHWLWVVTAECFPLLVSCYLLPRCRRLQVAFNYNFAFAWYCGYCWFSWIWLHMVTTLVNNKTTQYNHLAREYSLAVAQLCAAVSWHYNTGNKLPNIQRRTD